MEAILLVSPTLESIPVERPQPDARHLQGLCLDKGYDYDEVRERAGEYGFTLHQPRRGEQPKPHGRSKRKKARRWVVERTHEWIQQIPSSAGAWEKREDTYLAMLHLALGIITWFHELRPL